MPRDGPTLRTGSVSFGKTLRYNGQIMDLPQTDPVAGRRKEPLYKSLMTVMRQRIESGTLPPGARAPSESDLIAEFRVSSTTARRCLDELERMRLVRRVQGKGTFVADRELLSASRQIAVVYNELFSLADIFSAHMLRGIGHVVDATNHRCVLLAAGTLRRYSDPSVALREFVHRDALEAVIAISPLPLPWIGGLLDEGLPVASVNFCYTDARVYSAIPDTRSAMDRLSRRLAEQDHRRIVLIRQSLPQDMLEGVRLVHTSLELGSASQWQEESYPYIGPDETQHIVDRHLAQKNRPTAFVTIGYELALRVRHAVKLRGLSIPEDVSLAFIGVPPGPSDIDGEIAPVTQMAEWATQAVLDSKVGKEPAERVAKFPFNSNAGQTIGAAGSGT